ncbi:amidase domain-containing protein [Diaminobutyricibacter sp. McL0608]|uniref:amidase domain-containing protein n=1 Tax=Leifsonia sp. McL0608 TaxID=3143537 RepID=UPI0031F2F9ED
MSPLLSRRLASVTAIGVGLLLTGCSGAGFHRDTPMSGTEAVVTGTTQSAADNTAKQLAYAMAHWNDYNTAEYGDLNPVGGDCANFVSQTLIARGWKMNSQWFNHNAADQWSPAWGYVPAMDDYLRANATQLGITQFGLDHRDRIKVGDIVMFDWDDNNSLDHVQIVSAKSRAGSTIRIKMVGHNVDTDYRDLDETITVDHPGAVGHFWALSK